MTYVVSFTDYTPTARYDATPWTNVRIQECATSGGTFVTLETQALSPVDADPTHPVSRNITTTLATIASGGWYRIVFVDAALNEQPTTPVQQGSAAPLTVTQIRELVETDLIDSALQRIVNDAHEMILEYHGPHTGDVTERFLPGSGDTFIFTKRRITSVTSIKETYTGNLGETVNTLAASDYALESGRQIRRKIGGTYPRSFWAPMVTVTYSPADELVRRQRVLVDLVRLGVRYEAAQMTQTGDSRIQHVDVEVERSKILRRLDATGVGGFA